MRKGNDFKCEGTTIKEMRITDRGYQVPSTTARELSRKSLQRNYGNIDKNSIIFHVY